MHRLFLKRAPLSLPALSSSPAMTLFVALACLVAVLSIATKTRADERILSYVSTIHVQASGALRVREAIKVVAEGRDIKRGIYRDFPLYFRGPQGASHKVGFNVVSVERDGHDEPYTLRPGGAGVRIYIGDEDALIAHGEHTYTITYDTTRQIRFFDDHDELFWNVTGQEWAFPIDRAVARVILPDGVSATRWTAYTGAQGAKGGDWTVEPDSGGNELVFATTRTLKPHEGFSIVVAMPKGAIAAPSQSQRAEYFLLDHKNQLLGALGLALVLVYFIWAWRRVGRDPPAGTVIPLFEAPEGVSPALANYIGNKGFSGGGWRALSSACIDLAVKGDLELEDLDAELTLVPTGKRATGARRGALGVISGRASHATGGQSEPLPLGERAILDALADRPLTLSKDNGTSVKALGQRFRSAIEGENRNRFFKSNLGYWIPGVGLSILVLLAMLFFSDLTADDTASFFPVIAGAGFLFFFVLKLARSFARGGFFARAMQVAIFGAVGAIILLVFMTNAVHFLLDSQGTPILVVAMAAVIVVNVLFYVLMGAPTTLGRTMMDRIEGLKLYLSVAESERMNMAGAPQMSPNRFETLLPYAVALEVEKPWSDAFQGWLATSAAAAAGVTAYAPLWYRGRSFDMNRFGSSMSGAVDAMSQGFTSSLPQPKSSSSGFGGGGGAGGGGGGGGGGGW